MDKMSIEKENLNETEKSALNIADVMCSLLCLIGIHKKTFIWKSDYQSKYECSRCKSKFIHEHHLGGRKYKVD
jgi:hypothetical protein